MLIWSLATLRAHAYTSCLHNEQADKGTLIAYLLIKGRAVAELKASVLFSMHCRPEAKASLLPCQGTGKLST